jgi:regulator of cell morphogenesis and NO signaling
MDHAPETDWETAPLPVLVDHIEARFHRALERELPRLRGLLLKTASVHGAPHRARFAALEEALDELREELEPHLKKEEEILFLWIRAGRGETASAAVKVLAEEHASLRDILAEIRELANGYVVPAGACSTWRALWDGLRGLERELYAHLHLEDAVLFPRALA